MSDFVCPGLDFVALDFETANRERNSVCAIGIVVVQDGTVIGKERFLVRPPRLVFESRHGKIHGIRQQDVEDEETFDELWPQLQDYFSNRVIVAHNAESVEINMLRNIFGHFRIEPPEFHYFCTQAMAQAAWPDGPEKFSLQSVADYLDVGYESHDPVEDARACALAVLQACRDEEANSVEELARGLGVDLRLFCMTPGNGQPSDDSDDGWDAVVNGFAKEDIEAYCGGEGAFKKGEKLFRSGKVAVESRGVFSWSATVAGSGKNPYDVRVNRTLAGECSCPAWLFSREQKVCKHTIAVFLAWDAEGGPSPMDDLSDEEQRECGVELISQMPAENVKELLLVVMHEKPHLFRQLFLDD